ncbi:MAG: hydantoinase/oxoprolinase family protein, partial [Longimicrobiales bacterium]|nr:hydantoinase/oxoprolinase family protein [Longimicrobiales bacterium]
AEAVDVMGSAGGLLPLDRAIDEPVQTVLSGPAGGVVGALAWARAVGREGIVTFDMGGTSTDVSLCPGRALHTREFEIAGVPVAIPMLDIHTVGAGGGSVAYLDPGGALRVGPESAGADPGPICYGRGGREVTVTDAHVWLGRMPVDAFLGGAHTLDREAIAAPLGRLAEALGTTREEAAAGILEVATTTMERALRVISVERGFDPADFALVAFGGAGGLHAAELSERLGCAEALIPPSSGLLSAWGILAAPPSREASRSVLRSGDDVELPALVAGLEEAARAGLIEDGVAEEEIEVERSVEIRYSGQSFELRVPADGAPEAWAEAFHAAHARRYGYARHDRGVEVVTLRAIARGRARLSGTATPSEPGAGDPSEAPARSARVWVEGRAREVPVLERGSLAPGTARAGPLVVIDASSTLWVPERFEILVHPSGVLRLRREVS